MENEGIPLSRRRIRRIMHRLNLVSVYQKAAFNPHSKGKNEAAIPNHLARQFHQEKPLKALVTDLTYVRVGNGWAYDNAVAESTYRAFKIEFIHQETFQSLEELILKTKDYVHWWNYHRIHGSLNYQTPMTKRLTV